MGDTWPYGGPTYTTWQAAYNEVVFFTGNQDWGHILAAIASAESSLDLNVVNDTPATGDYSVGAWQINYYNGLYSGRVAEFGTPASLVAGGLGVQARAAVSIAEGANGFHNWSTYNNGDYLRFLHGYIPVPNPFGPGPSGEPLPPAPPAPAKDWSAYIGSAAIRYRQSSGGILANAATLRRI